MGLRTFRLDEAIAMIQVKLQMRNADFSLKDDEEDLKFCYVVLKDVSRSFAAVIMQLKGSLRDAVTIFYLVLRALDTIEDDMDIPVDEKMKSLPKFHEKLEEDNWSIDGIGKGMERTLLQEFYRVAKEYQKLDKAYQEVISDICQKMAMGMCHYLTNVVVTKEDYNHYCHYVAGLVGHGLTRLFANSGMEDPHLADDLSTANSMGLFLQKTNIIRDYYEDIIESPPRIFWPKDIWGLFGDSMESFKDPANSKGRMQCLNAMVADALQHLPDCVRYMASLKEPSVFLFCSIPQVMAIATLSEVYNNELVFSSKVKIRKGLACKIILNCTDLQRALGQFAVHMEEMETALVEDDPSYDLSRHRLKIGRESMATHLRAAGVVAQAPRSFIQQLVHYPVRVVRAFTGLFQGSASHATN